MWALTNQHQECFMATEDSIPTHRDCTKCRESKLLTEFTKAERGKYGRASRCRTCAAEYARANKDRINELSLARYHRLQAPKRVKKAEEREAWISVETKCCASCQIVKSKHDFGARKSSRDGKHVYCKACVNAKNKLIRDENPERAAGWSKKWVAKNKDKADAKRRRWLEANPGRQAVLAKRWRTENKERFQRFMARYLAQPKVRVHRTIRERLRTWLRSGRGRTMDALDYSFEDLVRHLELQFLPGMTWDNYGSKWHIDHIVPLAHFDVKDINDLGVKQAWALSNLRPLWAEDNLKKHAKRIFLI